MAQEGGITEKEEASAVVARENDFPEGAEGGLEIGCDHLGFVAREDDVRCDANSRVSVEEVRFEIVTYIWALLSGEGVMEGTEELLTWISNKCLNQIFSYHF